MVIVHLVSLSDIPRSVTSRRGDTATATGYAHFRQDADRPQARVHGGGPHDSARRDAWHRIQLITRGSQVLQLKQQLQEKEGIDVAQIRLIFNGKQLVDDQLLESYGVKASEVVHMVLALRG